VDGELGDFQARSYIENAFGADAARSSNCGRIDKALEERIRTLRGPTEATRKAPSSSCKPSPTMSAYIPKKWRD